MTSLLTLALLAFTTTAFAQGPIDSTAPKKSDEPAEIQIFLNYKAPSQYDAVLYSTVAAPLSAEPLYYDWNDDEPANGACFKGQPDEALLLFEDMVTIMNHDHGLSIVATGSSYFDEETKTEALEIWGYDHATGQEWNWFPRLRRCQTHAMAQAK